MLLGPCLSLCRAGLGKAYAGSISIIGSVIRFVYDRLGPWIFANSAVS
jgi:hypothetical protein